MAIQGFDFSAAEPAPIAYDWLRATLLAMQGGYDAAPPSPAPSAARCEHPLLALADVLGSAAAGGDAAAAIGHSFHPAVAGRSSTNMTAAFTLAF